MNEKDKAAFEALLAWKEAEHFQFQLPSEKTDAQEAKLFELWNKAESLREAALKAAKGE